MAAVNYATVADMLSREPDLDDSQVSSAQLLEYLRDAEAEINATLAKRYTVPVTGSPPMLHTIAVTLGLGHVLEQRVFTAGSIDDSPWPARFKEVRELLKRLADGEMTLISSAGEVVGANSSVTEVWSNTQSYLPTNTERGPRRDLIDPNKADDADDARDFW